MSTTFRSQIDAFYAFAALQCLDALTTLAFLSKGIDEGNPLVRWSLSMNHVHWIGLVLTKLTAATIGWYCYRTGRIQLLRWANFGYTAVVGWNVIAIAVGAIA